MRVSAFFVTVEAQVAADPSLMNDRVNVTFFVLSL